MDAATDDILVTVDISPMYTSIVTANGDTAISYYYEMYPSLLPSRIDNIFLIDLYKLCQENILFRFGDITYRQTSGPGMGRIYPSLADLQQRYDEVILQERIRVTFLPVLSSYFLDSYGRFLDDINFIWNRQWLREL